MLKVWGRLTSSNVQKVLWTARELGLVPEIVEAGGCFGGLETPEFRALNPNAQVPVLDDKGFILWESNAIVRYLAAKYDAGGLWPSDLHVRADADRWMDWQQTRLLPAFFPVYAHLVRTLAAQRDPDLLARQIGAAAEIWGLLDQALAGRDYLAGDRLTMGDIPVAVWAHRWYRLVEARPAMAHLDSWYARVSTRPAFMETLVGQPFT